MRATAPLSDAYASVCAMHPPPVVLNNTGNRDSHAAWLLPQRFSLRVEHKDDRAVEESFDDYIIT